MQYKYTP